MSSSVLSSEAISLFKRLASHPVKAKALLQDDACIGGLIMVLSNPNAAIVVTALETLVLLAGHVENRARLRNFMGMREQIQSLMDNCLNHIQNLSKELWALLMSDATTQKPQQTPLKTQNQNRPTPRRVPPSSKKPAKNFFLGGKSKTLVLQITGLQDKHDMNVCRNYLLGVRGVISITFDLCKKRSMIRVKEDLQTELLIEAISKTGTMSAKQVIKNESGNEVFLSFGQEPASSINKENPHFPPYLEDDELSPVKNDHTIARIGVDDESVTGMFSKVTNFFSKSFYW